ncbi:MAG: thioredoxin family protein [Dehalococcoidia bacterium]|nr:thioredoxin family protein [Dehalococcoidia bacterium]
MRSRAILLLLVPLLLLAACGDTSDDAPSEGVAIPGGATWVDDPFSGGYPTYDDEATGLRIVFGTPDLGTGTSRVSFALFDDVGLISEPTLTVTTRFYPDGAEGDFESGEEAQVQFRPFPEGSRGIYTGALTFDTPGLWALDVAVPAGAESTSVVFPVEVAEEAQAPAVGDPAPASDSRTVADEPDLAELSTATTPDPRLHQASITDALTAGTPFVVTFASPAYCTNALCGPQVEVLSELADQHGDAASFIHVDLYENPTEIRGDFSLARRTPVLDEWGIHTDEWTFVVDADGRVGARFEGFAPREEVEAALLAVLP